MNKLIKSFLENVKKNNVAVDSIVVEENGKVEEKVLNNIDLHQLRSCSKILIAFAYGIAIDEKFVCKDGKPLTLQSKVYDTFAKITNPPKQVKEWTIRTLLTYSTGYEKMLLNKSHVELQSNIKQALILLIQMLSHIYCPFSLRKILDKTSAISYMKNIKAFECRKLCLGKLWQLLCCCNRVIFQLQRFSQVWRAFNEFRQV